MKKNVIIILLVLAFLMVVKTNFVGAGTGPLSAKFFIKLDEKKLDNGDWNLYFLNLYTRNDFDRNNAYSILTKINKEYVEIKAKCGLKDSFKLEGGKAVAVEDVCKDFEVLMNSKMKWGNSKELIPYNYYDWQRNLFIESSHRSEIGGKIIGYSDATKCEISGDGSCTFFVSEGFLPSDGTVIVLEKDNSDKEVYFSKPTIIFSDDFEKKINWGSGVSHQLDLKEFSINKLTHELNIDFGYNNSVFGEVNYKNWREILFFVFLLVFIGLFLFFILRHRNNKVNNI